MTSSFMDVLRTGELVYYLDLYYLDLYYLDLLTR